MNHRRKNTTAPGLRLPLGLTAAGLFVHCLGLWLACRIVGGPW